jgi:HK97 family phage major capsid protein
MELAATRNREQVAEAFFASGAALARSPIEREGVEELLRRRFAEHPRQLAIARAAQAPATTGDASWAGPLVNESVAAFIALLAPASVLANLPLDNKLAFAGLGRLRVPARAPGEPTLGAQFRAEGDPIRVGALHLTSQTLTPKTLAILGTFTEELLRRAAQDVEAMVRAAMQRDTGIGLDEAFLDAHPGDTVRPPGLQALATGANTRPSSGSTVDAVSTDLLAAAAALVDSGCGAQPVWVMNTLTMQSLMLLRTTTGDLGFPTLSEAPPALLAFPVVSSPSAPEAVVFLVDCAELVLAADPPRFSESVESTLHEEDTTPLPISSPGTPNTVAAPERSMFQTAAVALRAVWTIDWAVLAAGAVQTITGVALRVPRTVPPRRVARFVERGTVVKDRK